MYQMLTPQERIATRFIPNGYTEYKRHGDSVVYASPDHLHAIAYRGKKARSEWYYQFLSENSFLSAVSRFFESIEAHEQRKITRKKEQSEFTTTLKTGDIIVESWGYEQTNVNFYQVIAVNGKQTITIREICATYEETGFMQGTCIPRKDVFTNDSLLMKKRVYKFGTSERVNIRSYSSAQKWDGKPEFCSWYG